jgi:2-C-methyl-D-erythritol 4-phosphate cytidylyltransferase
MYAVIPAAGDGSRMGLAAAAASKVLLPLGSAGSVLNLTLQALVEAEVFKGIAIAVREDEQSCVAELLDAVAPKLEHFVVRGGATRQASVYAAIEALQGRAEFVLVHDAARPLCPVSCIRESAKYVRECGATILAVPAVASLKLSKTGEEVSQTVPRRTIWEAQTPQAFRLELLLKAHRQAEQEGYTGTDDSELVERLGVPVRIVEGSRRNIKITTPEDLAVARALLAADN